MGAFELVEEIFNKLLKLGVMYGFTEQVGFGYMESEKNSDFSILYQSFLYCPADEFCHIFAARFAQQVFAVGFYGFFTHV